jgi:hypothetical protein
MPHHFPPTLTPLPYWGAPTKPKTMAYIITTDALKHARGEGSVRDPPFLLVLSRWESGVYRLEPLETWLARHSRPKEKAVPPTLSTPRPTQGLSDTG